MTLQSIFPENTYTTETFNVTLDKDVSIVKKIMLSLGNGKILNPRVWNYQFYVAM